MKIEVFNNFLSTIPHLLYCKLPIFSIPMPQSNLEMCLIPINVLKLQPVPCNSCKCKCLSANACLFLVVAYPTDCLVTSPSSLYGLWLGLRPNEGQEGCVILANNHPVHSKLSLNSCTQCLGRVGNLNDYLLTIWPLDGWMDGWMDGWIDG